MASLSVIIPNFNRSQLIGQTLSNMLAQSRPSDEIIVVDDGSTDDSVQTIRSFGNRVVLIEQENQGPGAARNNGLRQSSGDFVAFMDSDDLASHNKLEVQSEALISTGADLAYGPWIRSRIGRTRIEFLGPVLQGRELPQKRSMLEWQLGGWCTVFQACLFRRSALEAGGCYRTDMKVAEDGEFLVRILAAGAATVYTGGCMLYYRSDSGDQLTGSATSERCRAADLTRYFSEIGINLAQRLDGLASDARRDLALQVFRHNRHCLTLGIGPVEPSNPVMILVNDTGLRSLRGWDLVERAERRILRRRPEVPRSRGMQVRKSNELDHALARETVATCLI